MEYFWFPDLNLKSLNLIITWIILLLSEPQKHMF